MHLVLLLHDDCADAVTEEPLPERRNARHMWGVARRLR